ncbi:YihY/virulence factor BrkB family protein [Cryobacterium sp. BB736]|uniref:YihY/virulence factor BrkB family protein n=1 Tax=Cryobacterium sp. BB736 TaxID=2746963 RepID=UPI001873781C
MASGLGERAKRAVEWAKQLRPVRVFVHFIEFRGPLMAAGLAFHGIFATFAAIWVAFASAGLFIEANPELRDALFDIIDASVPGLLEWNGTGAVDTQVLLEAQILGWTGLIAAVGLLITALNWLAAARDAVRALFDLPNQELNFFLLKLKDAGLAVAFGIALVISSGLSVFSTAALDTMLGWLGIPTDSPVASVAVRVIGLLLMLSLDTVVLAALFRVMSGLVIPARRLFAGALIGAVGLGVLKVLGTVLLGGATRNPLLASFAAIIGLLIWFNLVCSVILLAASWISVGMTDVGLIADPHVAAERKEAARRERELIARQLEAEHRRRHGRLWRLLHPGRRDEPDARDGLAAAADERVGGDR